MPMITSVGINITATSQSVEKRLLIHDIVRDEMRRDGYKLSNTSAVYRKLDEFLNLGSTKDLNMSDLSPQEREIFLKILSKLLKLGFVSYNLYEVNGKPEKHFVVNTIGDTRLYGKKILRQ